MAFEFRLETLLRIRRRMKEAAEMEFASLVHRRDKIKAALESEHARLEEAERDLEHKMKEGIMSEELHLKWLQISELEDRCRQLAWEMRKAEHDLSQGKKELSRRHVDEELVENLRDRDLRRYLKKVDSHLQKELDDLASIRYSRLRNFTK